MRQQIQLNHSHQTILKYAISRYHQSTSSRLHANYRTLIHGLLMVGVYSTAVIRYFIDILILQQMSHHPSPRTNFSPQVQPDFQDNNDSLLDQSNSFDLKNQIFELSSKCNNLQYEKNKILMSYQNVLKEQKQKYAILERVCSEKQEREEKLTIMVTELRSKCAYLTDQNEALKKELHSIFQKNRITPNFNSLQLEKEMNVLGDLLEKEERMQKLDKQLQEAKESEYSQLKERVNALEKENKRLREENVAMQAEKNETIKIVTHQAEEYHKGIIKFKDATIQDLKNEQINLTLQLEQANSRNSQRSDGSAQNRRKQEKMSELEERLNILQRQRTRIQNENHDIRQDNKRLQSEKKTLERSKKSLQEELYQLNSEISEVRAAAFNDKIECKKQVNTIKLEIEEEKAKLRSIIEEKTQENKRLREGVLTLNDQNQQLRDRQANHSKQLAKLMEENRLLTLENDKYLREGNKWEAFAGQSSKKNDLDQQNEQAISDLKAQLAQAHNQVAFTQGQLKQISVQLEKRSQQLRINEQLVQIMKIDQKQFDQKLKQGAKKLKQSEQSKNQKEKVITNLQMEIKSLKDDNRQLQLANEQLREKLETMKTINSDIEDIKKQLQLQKKYYQQMRQQQEELRKKHRQSQSFKSKQENSKEKPQMNLLQFEQSVKASVQQSRQRDAQLSKQMQLLKSQVYDLQAKLNEAQNQIDKKGIDINMKEEENLKLKALLNSPRELNFEPIIETSKKNQFNAVFLQNKILLLEKEILGIKTLKDKELQQYKKTYRKKVDEKYLVQFKKSSIYIGELQKNIELLNDKLAYEAQSNKELRGKLQQITKENYDVKCDYSDTLEELNSLLQKYKILQKQLKQLEFDRSQFDKICEENNRLKSYLAKLSKNAEEKSLRLSNANDQIQKLNQTLMVKQSEIKMLKVNSPNSSFIASNRGEQRSSLLNVPSREAVEMEVSSDNDSLRSWVKKCPNYSRV